MKGLKKHLELYPARIRSALLRFQNWESVSEIRLRRGLPLSLTHFGGNLFLDEAGRTCGIENALKASGEEIAYFAASFCKGSVYRYFDGLREGYAVDEDGYRLGLCPDGMTGERLATEFAGANLRIPRLVAGAARELLTFFENRPLASTLILSPPGGGKTTLLRDLALSLSRGSANRSPLRVAVIDPRRELMPAGHALEGGLCDVVAGMDKANGIEIALRLLSPQVILCDEIGSPEEADAMGRIGRGGCLVFASAHGASKEEMLSRPSLAGLCREGVFAYIATLTPQPGTRYRAILSVECVS